MKKDLIVYSKNFGKTFTGATIATYEVLKRSRDSYEKLIIVCQNYDKDSIKDLNAKVYKVNSVLHSVRILNKLPDRAIYLNDDHFGFILFILRKKYIHWYHGNWPDALLANLELFLKGMLLFPMYILTIIGAKKVINVSAYMNKFTKKLNSNSEVFRNGIKQSKSNQNNDIDFENSPSLKVLMVGNIDKRKFLYAKKLFDNLEGELNNGDLDIDIYGGINDDKLASTILSHRGIIHQGFSSNIPYKEYDVLLSTSTMENLSIAVCEALKSHLPVICFDVGGLSEVVHHNKNGMVVPNKDYCVLRESIIELLNGNITLDTFYDEQMSEYDWDKTAIKFKALISKFLS